MARTGLAARHQHSGTATERTRRSRSRGRPRVARGAGHGRDSRHPAPTARESRSESSISVPHAGALRRRGRTRSILRVAPRRAEPIARSVGARCGAIPPPPPARRRRHASTCGRHSISSGRFSAPVTSSSRSDGPMRRSAATSRCKRPRRSGRSSTRSRPTTRLACAGSCWHPLIRCSVRHAFSNRNVMFLRPLALSREPYALSHQLR